MLVGNFFERKNLSYKMEENIFKPLRSDVIDCFKNNRISCVFDKKLKHH